MSRTPKAERLHMGRQEHRPAGQGQGRAGVCICHPDLRGIAERLVGGPELTGAKRVTATNAFQSNYAWSHSELIEYKSPQGARGCKARLYYPGGYEAGQEVPDDRVYLREAFRRPPSL